MKKFLKYQLGLLAIMMLVVMACEEDEIPQVAIANQNMASAYPGDQVTLEGTNFNTIQFVFIGNRQAAFQLDGDVLTFTVPESATPGQNVLTLAMANNYRVTGEIEVLIRPNPVIQSISPSAVAPGENVTIRGVSLDNLVAARIGEIDVTVVSNTAEELVVTVPDGLAVNTPAEIYIETTGGVVTSQSTFYVGQNLALNGQLEAGSGNDFDNWGKWNGGNGMTATSDPDEAYSGRAVKVVAVGGDAWRSQFVSDPIATTIGVEYTLMMWIKAEAGTPGDGGNIRFSTNPNAQYSGNYDITTEWQQVSWAFTANADQTRAVLDLGVVANAVYFVDNITVVATGQAGGAPIEVLLNGGFEEGSGNDFTNWSKFNGGDFLTATTNASEVRRGSRALKAVGDGRDAWRTQMASDPITMTVGVEYTASFWIKGEAGSPGIGGSVRMSTNASAGALYSANFTVTGEWQKIEWTFTANDPATRLVLDLGATANAVYFVDDVSVTEPPAQPAENIVLNGGFEEGTGNDFTNWSKLNGADFLTATTVSAEVYRGSRALKAVGDGRDAWRTQFASDPITMTVGTDYTASFWIKGEAGSPGIGGSVRMSTNASAGALYSGNFTVTADWQKVEWTFTANDAATRLVLDLGATANAVYFVDNVEVFEQ